MIHVTIDPKHYTDEEFEKYYKERLIELLALTESPDADDKYFSEMRFLNKQYLNYRYLKLTEVCPELQKFVITSKVGKIVVKEFDLSLKALKEVNEILEAKRR